jgi:hypothetical protein
MKLKGLSLAISPARARPYAYRIYIGPTHGRHRAIDCITCTCEHIARPRIPVACVPSSNINHNKWIKLQISLVNYRVTSVSAVLGVKHCVGIGKRLCLPPGRQASVLLHHSMRYLSHERTLVAIRTSLSFGLLVGHFIYKHFCFCAQCELFSLAYNLRWYGVSGPPTFGRGGYCPPTFLLMQEVVSNARVQSHLNT